MTKPTILLTGATGFLGSYLLVALLDNKYRVAILKRSTSDTWRIDNLLDGIPSYDVDRESISLAFREQKIDCIIHTACHYGRNGDSINQILDSNLLLGVKVLEAALEHGVSTFINTDSLLPRNLNAYSLSKKQMVDWLMQKSTDISIINLKLEHMYGPKDDTTKFVPWVISQINQNVPSIQLTKGEQKRDFIYIDDVVSAFLTVLQHSTEMSGFKEFEVGSGELVTIREFLEELIQSYLVNIGASETVLKFGALPYREGELMTVKVNNEALKAIGWTPRTNFKQGLKKSLRAVL